MLVCFQQQTPTLRGAGGSALFAGAGEGQIIPSTPDLWDVIEGGHCAGWGPPAVQS